MPYLVLFFGGVIIVFLIRKRQKKLKLQTVHIRYLVVFFCNEISIFTFLFYLIFLVSSIKADEGSSDISFYTGTFDVIDKEGDDQTSLFGVEHKNPDLFRDTFLGKFKPITGAFITGNSSFIYTQVLKVNMELVH